MIKQLRAGSLVVLLCGTLLSVPRDANAQTPTKEAARVAKMTPDLLAVMKGRPSTNGRMAAPGPGGSADDYVIVDGAVAIEGVAVDQRGDALLAQLQALGLREGVAFKSMIFGYLPIDKLDELKDVSGLHYARPYYKPINNAGKVTSQGDKSLRADVARATYSVTGAGSKVGVISDTYNALKGAAAGVASGDLPAEGVQVIDDLPSGTDEGRAMAEIVHDVAPGAAIAFNTAFRGQAGFAKGIIDLANAGCNIIVDDVIYFAEPFFQDGIIGQAVDQVVTNNNVSYFSSAGNQGRASYMSQFRNSGIVLPGYGVAHDFGGGDIYQKVTIPTGGTIRLSFQWDDPFRSVSGGTGAKTDLDILIYRGNSLVSSSASDNIFSGDPVEITGTYTNTTGAPLEVNVVIVKYAGPDPGTIRWVNVGSRTSIVEYNTQTGASFGHSNATRAICVGAAPYFSTPSYNSQLSTAVIETFSSAGGVPIYFDATGQRINGTTGVTRQKPEITAVDGGNNTFFGNDYEPDGFPNFFGTSAAAPHAAAVAALMQERAGNKLSPAQILSTMQQTALDMDDPVTPGFDTGFDFGTGYGFVQADKALQTLGGSTLVITGVNTLSCVSTSETERQLTFNPQYSGSNGQPIAFRVVNEKDATTDVGPYTIRMYTDNPVITLRAEQAGAAGIASFSYNWLAACTTATTTNQPPVFNGVPTLTGTINTAFRYAIPATAFTDPEGQPMTFAMTNLPAGLVFDVPTRVISGTPQQLGTTNAALTATDPSGATTSGTVTISVSDPVPTPADPASLTITSFTCNTLSTNRFSVDFVVGYSNGTFTPALPALFMNGVTGDGQLGVRYTYFYDENQYILPIQDQATRSTYFVWNFRAACGSAPVANRPPVFNGTTAQSGVVGVPFSYTLPATTFTDPDGQVGLTYTAASLPPGLTFTASTRVIRGTPTTAGQYTVQLTARDPGALTARGTLPITITQTAPVAFAITSVNTTGCERLSPSLRLVTFTPQYAGASGAPIMFHAVNEAMPTTNAGPYSLNLYTDNPTILLRAEQDGTVTTYTYNWLAVCTANGRLGVSETREALDVAVLANPSAGETIEVEIRGASGQPLEWQLVDERGQAVSRSSVKQAATVERQTVKLGRQLGVYLLTVSTPAQTKTVRVLKN
ncbi:putative Ig domain-containing protein [uncultured Spirosoma sp.]|uniref:putative Ig domain-containing protein n=1 Tax=uncultured Spirosoma sp. TaxID=278208 RepID=UPI00258597DF|nr:putative Ig domain-containing protein [uncultured Spirosoma sp.]